MINLTIRDGRASCGRPEERPAAACDSTEWLCESVEVLGRECTLARIDGAAARLAAPGPAHP